MNKSTSPNHSQAPNYITPEGLKKLKDELSHLLLHERPQVVKTVTWAASLGDRSENADYIYGKRRLREIDRRIRFLEKRLEYVEIIDPKTQSTQKVQFGATVTLADENNKHSTYQIVGEDEFDLKLGKISWNSPIAKALLGKATGDVITVQRPIGPIEYEIVRVSYEN